MHQYGLELIEGRHFYFSLFLFPPNSDFQKRYY